MGQGRLLPEQRIFSRYLGTNRIVRVYLPPSYDQERRRRYPVLYLHDGQNVFSAAGTNCCLGWGSWELDKTVDALVAAGRMQEIIMVGIDNSKARYAEYCGPTLVGTGPGSKAKKAPLTPHQAYAKFLIQEIKPHIDRQYRTRKTRSHTGVMGSSLGGLCSLALAWEHPKTFGLVGCMSGAFQVERAKFLKNGLGAYSGRKKALRIYLDSGTADFTGDDDGCKLTSQVAEELRRIGWRSDLKHFVDESPLSEAGLSQSGLRGDKWAEAQKSQHNEFYWRRRAWRPLQFLFPPS